MSIKISLNKLPIYVHYLLTQPLMTKGIETYYQRTPSIQTINASKNRHNNTYHRLIRMLVDRSISNNVKLAQSEQEIKVVELAFITMNFNALPKNIIYDVQNTSIPFGQLLINNHIHISNRHRSYFTVICNSQLRLLMNCHLKSTLYGRKNTIVNAKNQKWLAHVVEILSEV
ncbi:MAG: hypothetical protein H0U75_04830 [Legionella sp.]|nr:hypothetical protein [Legionella sp.]